MARLGALLVEKFALKTSNYQEFWQWSVDHPAIFWEEVWNYTGVVAHQPHTSVRVARPSILGHVCSNALGL